MKRPLLDRIMKISLVVWSISFSFPQFITNFIFQRAGAIFAYTGFYWLFYVGLIGLALVISWKYDYWFVKMISLPIFAFWGYMSFQYLQPPYFILNLPQAIFNVILMGILMLNLLYSLVYLIVDVFSYFKGVKARVQHISPKKIYPVLITVFLVWLIGLSWSYVGFSQTYKVEYVDHSTFRVSFWGLPFGGADILNYNNPQSDAELSIYEQLNSSFIFPTSIEALKDPNSRGKYTAVMHELEEWNIEFVCDCTPTFPWFNETSQSWSIKSDFVGYYYTQEVNATIDTVVEWVQAENFTNFRGISLDIEGPKYHNDSYKISREKYESARLFFQNKLDWFKLQLPGAITNMISVDAILWDLGDGDHDYDISQLAVGPELDFDTYGYMNYFLPGISPKTTSYNFAVSLAQGKQMHGQNYQPWIGWLPDPEFVNDPNSIENSIIFNSVIEQFKVALSFGLDEVVIAPVRNYLGRDQPAGIERMQNLLDIRETGFETFEVKITNNMRLVNDLPMWWEKIHPVYWLSNEFIFRDLMMGTPTNWFFRVNLGLFLILLGYSGWHLKKTHSLERLENIGKGSG